MRVIGSIVSSSGHLGPVYSPGDLVVFGPPGSSCTDGRGRVIPGLKLKMGPAPVSVEWSTAAMVVKHNPIGALPELCLLVKGFVGWTGAGAVYPIDDWTRVIPGVAVDPDWPSETSEQDGQ